LTEKPALRAENPDLERLLCKYNDDFDLNALFIWKSSDIILDYGSTFKLFRELFYAFFIVRLSQEAQANQQDEVDDQSVDSLVHVKGFEVRH
jgi:hypothetical protein